MENIILAIHLILAVILISIVLVQNSDGGLGSMGGSSGTSLTSSRAKSTALSKLTWIIAVLFFITSISLTILSASSSKNNSLIEVEPNDGDLLTFPLPDTNLIDQDSEFNNSPSVPPPLE